MLPNTTRINRGGTVMKEMADACRANDFTDLVVLHEHRGQPGRIRTLSTLATNILMSSTHGLY